MAGELTDVCSAGITAMYRISKMELAPETQLWCDWCGEEMGEQRWTKNPILQNNKLLKDQLLYSVWAIYVNVQVCGGPLPSEVTERS